MPTTAVAYTSPRYRTFPGDGYDGVVRVSYGSYYATGSLLYDGRAILTAAHLFQPTSPSNGSGITTVTLTTSSGNQTLSTTEVLLHPGYDTQSNYDLAIVWLSAPAPNHVNRYDLYRQSDEIGQIFTLVGYGQAGSGDSGATSSNTLLKLKANNQFDADAATLKTTLGSTIGWTPVNGTQLLADFDNGNVNNDALGRLLNVANTGLGPDEGLIAQGDSGGPAFINNKVAGVASYTASISHGSTHPDIDQEVNSSFGEIAAWQRVSAYQQWIDQSLRAQYPNAPRQASEVIKAISEGNSGTSYTYFFLEFTGTRSEANQTLSVDYATRDGTAIAGSDYLAVSGTLNLYPGENYAVIPVEVIGDNEPEQNETFYLDVFNPVGGSFGTGILTLTAMRTIVDDDGWIS